YAASQRSRAFSLTEMEGQEHTQNEGLFQLCELPAGQRTRCGNALSAREPIHGAVEYLARAIWFRSRDSSAFLELMSPRLRELSRSNRQRESTFPMFLRPLDNQDESCNHSS